MNLERLSREFDEGPKKRCTKKRLTRARVPDAVKQPVLVAHASLHSTVHVVVLRMTLLIIINDDWHGLSRGSV